MSELAAIIGMLTLIANGVVAYLALRSVRVAMTSIEHQQRLARLNALIARKSMIMQSNAMALQCDANLKASMTVQFPEDASIPDQDARERFLAFNLLNCAEIGWMAREIDVDFGGAAQKSCDHFVGRLLRNPKVCELAYRGGYADRFLSYCEEQSPEFREFARQARSR